MSFAVSQLYRGGAKDWHFLYRNDKSLPMWILQNDIKQLAPYLQNYGPNQTMIDAALSGFTASSAWTDARGPEHGLLLCSALGFSFGWGEGLGEFLLAEAARQKKRFFFVVPSARSVPAFGELVLRLEYLEHGGLSALTGLLATKLRAAHLDRHNAEFSNWRPVLLDIFGNFENFEKFGGGIALFDGDTLVSESTIAFRGKHHVEIGTITHEQHRRKDYSSISCALLVEHLLRQGLRPSWSCNKDNTGSWKVAEKIGFRNPQEYKIYHVPRP